MLPPVPAHMQDLSSHPCSYNSLQPYCAYNAACTDSCICGPVGSANCVGGICKVRARSSLLMGLVRLSPRSVALQLSGAPAQYSSDTSPSFTPNQRKPWPTLCPTLAGRVHRDGSKHLPG